MKFKCVIPIFGFDDIKEYELNEVNENFYTLKSNNITFTLVNPFSLRSDYDFEISETEQNQLKLNENTKFMVLNIMIVNNPFKESTVNFAAPLIFNMDENIMGQVILDKYTYGLTEPLKNFIKKKQ